MHRLSRLLAGVVAAIAVVAGVLVPPPAAQAAAAEGIFVVPVNGRVGDVVGGCPAGSRPTHQGVDISLNANTNVYSAAAGTVTTAVNTNVTTGYGSQVVIAHAGGYTTRYAHLIHGSVKLKVGATVPRGAVLGRVGSTGNSTGPHLHFEMLRNGVNTTNTYFSCGQGTLTALKPLEPRASIVFPANADVNRDRRSDLLALSTAGRMVVYNGNGKGGWTTTTLGAGWGSTRAMAHGDFDGDGSGDFWALRTDGTLWLYRGAGKNAFRASQVATSWGSVRLISGGVDFYNDRMADFITVGAGDNLYFYAGNGAGGFAPAVKIGSGFGAIDTIIAGDFGVDGTGDLIARDTTGRLLLYPGNGAGLDVAAVRQIAIGWKGLTLTGGADYTSDGLPDLIGRDAAGGLWLYPWRGSDFGSRIKVGSGWNVHRLIH